METKRRADAMGMLLGTAVATTILAVVSAWLLSVDGTSAKVLVAVWLWTLPALGAGAGAGWLLAQLGRSLTRAGKAR